MRQNAGAVVQRTNRTIVWLTIIAISFFSSIKLLASEAASEKEHVAQEAGEKSAKKALSRIKDPTEQSYLLRSAIDQIVHVAEFRLNQRGLTVTSSKISRTWKSLRGAHFDRSAAIGLFKLGDHPPLSRWLAETYQELESVFGESMCHIYHFDDLKILNFGLPVAFSPQGDPQSRLPWGESEYLDHFVPVAGAITYWMGDLACEFVLQSTASIICSISLDGIRNGIEKFLAPHLGSFVYSYFNSQA